MKKIKFIKYAGVGLGLLGATMSLSYGEINLSKHYDEMFGQFCCWNKELQGNDAEKVLNFLRRHKANIHHIKMIGCTFGDDFFAKFADVLTDNKTLKTLDLSHNEIGDKDAKKLAGALQDNKSLEYLALNHNQIGDEGAKELAEALKKNTTLQKLWLYNNQIGDTGKKALRDAQEETNRDAASFRL